MERKKVFLEEFYQILKSAIDETKLLIRQKDRELFEDIVSQTISHQLTDRIANSRSWVRDMSNLMKQLDTSMGLSFLLEWRPRVRKMIRNWTRWSWSRSCCGIASC